MAGVKGMKIKNRKPMSKETRKNISESVKKRWQDKSYIEKVKNAHKHKLPDSWKKNISKGMSGMKRSDETKAKMSTYQSNRPKEVKQKQVESWRKQWNSLSKEEQLKRLEKWIDAGHEAERDGSYLKPSSIEIKVKEQLDEIGIRYVQQKRVYNGERYFFLDFYVPSLKLVIECNGDYWHSLPEKVERDKNLKKYVESTGRKIVFIWEHEINDEWFWVGDYLEGGDANA